MFSGSLFVSFEGLGKQHKSEGSDSLLVLPLYGLQTCFWLFYCLLWVCGPIRKPCKKPWQNEGITGGSLGGLVHRLGNFVCFCIFENVFLKHCKNIGIQRICRTDFDIDIVKSNL